MHIPKQIWQLNYWTTAIRFCMERPRTSWGESSRCRMPQHASSPEPDVVTIYAGAVSAALASCSAASGVQTRLSGASGIVRSNAYVPGWWYPSRLRIHRRSLRSSSDNMCAVPRTHNSFGDRSFGAAGPRIWNSLPCGLRTLDISYKLKTCVWLGHGALWHFI